MAGIYISKISRGLSKHVDFLLVLSAAMNLIITAILSIYGNLMYPFFILLYIWIAAYISLLAILIRRSYTVDGPLIKNETYLVALMFFALIIRILFLGKTHEISLDPLWYLDFGRFMHLGAVPYTGFYFPYPPVFAYFIYIITTLYQGVQGFRLLSILLDLSVLVALWKIVKQEISLKWASTASIAYAFLPISIIESGWSGHFEPLVSILILVSLLFLTKQKWSISGVFLGLAAATKMYPLVIFPILFTYIKEWKNRIWYTIGFVLSVFLAFVPIFVLANSANLSGMDQTVQGGPSSGLFQSIFGFLYNESVAIGAVQFGLILAVIIGVVYLMRQISRNDPSINTRLYYSVTIVIGLVVITIGVIAGLYPFLPVAGLIYWRFPEDIAIVRGISTICIGLLLTFKGYHERGEKQNKHVSRNSLLVLIGAVSLILIPMTQLFFYGWYLLWSIPFLLLMPDRRLSYTILVCLLLMYPNYTSNNFAGLGFDEPRQWQDEFTTVGNWSTSVNIKGNDMNASQISGFVKSNGQTGEFWFDTRNTTNDDDLSSLSISYIKLVELSFEDTTEFVAAIAASWDPPFGRYADLSLSVEGTDSNSGHIKSFVIPKTSMFTNLTYIQWRYDFKRLQSPTHNGIITTLNLTIYPVQRVESCYRIDSFYTTHAGIISPLYFLIIPSLVMITLAAVTFLYLELEREHELASPCEKGNKITEPNQVRTV
ncbi:MAG: glycosyltransferase family 87 protein [Promethearchaeota archaeon]